MSELSHIPQLRAMLLPERPGLWPDFIRCDIVFGAPKMNCLGTGICRIINHSEIPLFQRRQDCRQNPAFAVGRENGSVLQLVLYREMVCVQVYKNHLRKGVLEMAEACLLPEALVEELGLVGALIPAGNYAVTEMDGVLELWLPVAKEN